MNTSIISDNIMHTVNRSWFFDPETIHVGACLVRVTLTGQARSPHDRVAAAVTAWAASSVTDVVNEIAVR